MRNHQNQLAAVDPSTPSTLSSLLSISTPSIFKTAYPQENRSGPTSVRLDDIYEENTPAGPSNESPRESPSDPVPQTRKTRPNWDEEQKERREEEMARGYAQKGKKGVAQKTPRKTATASGSGRNKKNKNKTSKTKKARDTERKPHKYKPGSKFSFLSWGYN
jgi:hypothetical protein